MLGRKNFSKSVEPFSNPAFLLIWVFGEPLSIMIHSTSFVHLRVLLAPQRLLIVLVFPKGEGGLGSIEIPSGLVYC